MNIPLPNSTPRNLAVNDYIIDLCVQLQEHKSVVFHGPVNSGKSYLVQRLAQCLAVSFNWVLYYRACTVVPKHQCLYILDWNADKVRKTPFWWPWYFFINFCLMTMVLFQGHGKLSPKAKQKIVCSYFQFETPEHLAFLLFGCLAKKKRRKKRGKTYYHYSTVSRICAVLNFKITWDLHFISDDVQKVVLFICCSCNYLQLWLWIS